MADFEITFLGTGTSVGIPMIGCDCETCNSADPRDKRTRCSIWCRTPEMAWVVDTGPDFRAQCLREGVRRLDAALYTHSHMDHVVGFDELRRFTIEVDHFIPIHGTPACLATIQRMFGYAFDSKNHHRGYLKPRAVPVGGPFALGETSITPLPVLHGNVETIGYLFARGGRKLCAYLPDCKTVPDETLALMRGVDTLILDALRRTPHFTHMNFEEATACAEAVGARRTFFTHFQCEIMHARDEACLPPHIRLAYDGLRLEWP